MRTSRRALLLAIAASIALGATACTDADPTASQPFASAAGTDIGIRRTGHLRTFDSCGALLGEFRAAAVARVTPWGLDDGGWYGVDGEVRVFEDELAAAEAAPDGAPPTTAGVPLTAGDDVAHSTTNVQVAGIDEPDIVKTDGDRMLVVARGTLYLVDLTADNPTIADRLPLDGGWAQQLLLEGDRLIVLAQSDPWVIDELMASSEIAPPAPGNPLVTVTEVDLSTPGRLVAGRTLALEGSLVDGREADGIARLVVRAGPTALPFVAATTPASEPDALAMNRQVIEASTIDDWLPHATIVDGADAATVRLVDCEQVHLPDPVDAMTTTTVLAIDLAAPLSVADAASVLARADTVYANATSLYVAASSWPGGPVPMPLIDVAETAAAEDRQTDPEVPDGPVTTIHRFATDGTGTRYVASGTVAGTLLDQFALDEHDDVLRVATTLEAWSEGDTEGVVVTLGVAGDQLVQLGRVGGLGQGERVQSVRFVGDVGYVVTFRQTDPFYTVDLADPTAPTMLGELKIPGFSSYLHPISDTLVVGIGQDASETGRQLGTKVSLFDVADLSAPTEVATWTQAGSDSPVAWDHHAVLWWAPAGLLVVPVQSWEDASSSAVVLRIADRTVTEVGRISHADRAPSPNCVDDCWYGGSPIERALVVDQDIWTMTQEGLQANDLETLAVSHVLGL